MKPVPYEPGAGNESDPTPPNQSHTHTHAKPDKTLIRIYDCVHVTCVPKEKCLSMGCRGFEDPNLYDTATICVV